jgi:hypothetical protein
MVTMEMGENSQQFVGFSEGNEMEWMIGKGLLMMRSGLEGNGMTTLYLGCLKTLLLYS